MEIEPHVILYNFVKSYCTKKQTFWHNLCEWILKLEQVKCFGRSLQAH